MINGMSTHEAVGAKPLKRKRVWSTVQRKAAVAAALTADAEHPQSNMGMAAVASTLGEEVSSGTLNHWLVTYADEVRATLPQPTTATEAIIASRDSTLRKMQTVVDKTLDRLVQDKVLDNMAGRDLAVVMGINRDHIRKDTSVPIEVEMCWRQLQVVCPRLGYDPVQIIQDLTAHLTNQAKLLQAGEVDAKLLPGDTPTE